MFLEGFEREKVCGARERDDPFKTCYREFGGQAAELGRRMRLLGQNAVVSLIRRSHIMRPDRRFNRRFVE